eukprot:3396575-Alexandrium_andersonii.AAC.1
MAPRTWAPSRIGGLGPRRRSDIRKCQIASGGRNLNCAGPGTTSNSAPEGLVRGVRRDFAR